MDESAQNAPDSQAPQDSDLPAPDPTKQGKSAAEYAETFGKAVDVAEKVLRFAPLPMGAKHVAMRAMPTVKKVAKVAPTVAPVIEPYARKAVEQAKAVAPQVAQATKAGAKNVATGVQTGTKALAEGAQSGAKAAASGATKAPGRVRETAPKVGHAVADKATRLADKIRRKK